MQLCCSSIFCCPRKDRRSFRCLIIFPHIRRFPLYRRTSNPGVVDLKKPITSIPTFSTIKAMNGLIISKTNSSSDDDEPASCGGAERGAPGTDLLGGDGGRGRPPQIPRPPKDSRGRRQEGRQGFFLHHAHRGSGRAAAKRGFRERIPLPPSGVLSRQLRSHCAETFGRVSGQEIRS